MIYYSREIMKMPSNFKINKNIIQIISDDKGNDNIVLSRVTTLGTNI